MSHYRLPGVLLLGAVMVAGTAACGSQNASSGGSAATTTTTAPPAAVQVADVKSAMQNATAVHVKGSITDSGTKISVDVQLNKDGTASGTIADGGPNIPIVLSGKVIYLQFTPDVMKANGIDATSAAGQKLANKWVPSTSKLMSGSNLATSVQPFLDYTQFIGSLAQNMPAGALKAGKSDVINGTPVVLYTFPDGTPADVATSSPHYLVRLLPGPTDGAGQLDFTGWNQPVAVHAPPASQVFSG